MTSTKQCPNCSAPLYGQYCSQCGQNQKNSNRHLWVLLNEAFEGIFNWNSKAWRTTFSLFFKPGFLTAEHFAQRRARYISPIRLYIITSLTFFLTLSLLNFLGININNLNANIIVENSSQTSGVTAAQDSVTIPTLNPQDITIAVDGEPNSSASQIEKKLFKSVKNAIDNPNDFIANIIDKMPIVAFLLLPIYALIFKLFFLKTKRFYIEHLVLAIHNQSFFFATYTLILIINILTAHEYNSPLMTFLLICSPLYLAFSLKKTYLQSWALTIAKTTAICGLYFFLTLFSILAALLSVVLL